jgi:hypothetical protein
VLVELEALLIRATLPVAAPADCGEKLTVNDADCPGARVRGRVSPVAVKPAPVTFIWVIVALAVPLLLTITV